MSAPSPHADPPPEVVVDPENLQYETGHQLGKGGFAICHRAKLMGPEYHGTKPIALKIVRSKMEPPKLAQKFVTELQIHSKLAHPNIVEFYRSFSFETSTFVVLELCSNGSLADAIKKRKYFTMPEIRRFMIQTCGAIKYLHQRNIVHRDLKTGNLFLDEDMNVKVGDFGLAALLVSQSDFGAIRRTTMCGTPNYLAPEVLEKTGKGHDEKVDLWAIGIMMYTLAVGRAPFHAAKREDIYRKLKAREYTWPDLAKFPNEITDDLRDIVSLLLVHEDERPTPDQIVTHQFFRLGHVPLQLDSGCTSRVPKWPKIRPPTASTIKKGYTDEWYTMCKSSAVGEYAPGKTFGAYGSRRNKTVARDCQKEIESGKQPNIPFAKDTVYLPFPERTHWPFRPSNGLSEISEEKESSAEGRALIETTGNDRSSKEGPVRTTRRAEAMSTLKENTEPAQKIQEVETARRVAEKEPAPRGTEKAPTRMRSVRKVSNPDRATTTTAAAATVPPRVPRHTRTVQRPRTMKEPTQEKVERLPEVLPLRIAKPISRVPEKSSAPPSQPSAGLRLLGEEAPFSDPVAVLKQLYTFRENVTRALQKQPSNAPRTKSSQLPFVAKWVDYSRKHGVGYVLEDGTVGCLATATDQHPVTMAFCPDGNSYLKLLAKDPDYMSQIPIEYYASPNSRKALSRVEVTDATRSKVMRTIWSKFGKYMCVQLGLDDSSRAKVPGRPNFVRFYQRLGNVGIWGFVDGAFQVNFPDHTKLVISTDAGYCNFTCLSLEATNRFKRTGEIAWKCIKEREVLYGSPQQLLYGPAGKADPYKEIAEGNGLRMKLEFIESVFEGWIQGGGLGCLLDPTTYTWKGPQLEENKKEDWVSVGRFGGDVL